MRTSLPSWRNLLGKLGYAWKGSHYEQAQRRTAVKEAVEPVAVVAGCGVAEPENTSATQPAQARLGKREQRRRQEQYRQSRQTKVRYVEQLENRQMLHGSPAQLFPVSDPIANEVAGLNDDQFGDLVVLSSDGRVTTALNNGDDTWGQVQTFESGVAGAAGMAIGYVDADANLDLVIQGSDAIALALGDGNGGFTFTQTIFPGASGTLAIGSPLGLTFSNVDQNFRSDLISVSPGTNEVLVFLNDGSGTLGTPDRYASGAVTPIGVAVGQFVGNNLLEDIAVAHQDGTITFLEGHGDGTFTLRPELSVTGLGVITDVASLDADSDGDTDLVVASDTGVTLLTNDDDVLVSSPVTNASFTQGLTGWTAEGGEINALNGFAEIRENNDGLLTTLSQTFTIPENPQTISFDILSLGLEDPQGGIPCSEELFCLDLGALYEKVAGIPIPVLFESYKLKGEPSSGREELARRYPTAWEHRDPSWD